MNPIGSDSGLLESPTINQRKCLDKFSMIMEEVVSVFAFLVHLVIDGAGSQVGPAFFTSEEELSNNKPDSSTMVITIKGKRFFLSIWLVLGLDESTLGNVTDLQKKC